MPIIKDFKIQVNAFAKKNTLIIWKMRYANLVITLGIIISLFEEFLVKLAVFRIL